MDDIRPWGMDLHTFLLLLHLSQLAGMVLFGLGFVLPIIMWATNKELHPEIDRHGKVVVNWLLSAIVYSIICYVLLLIAIGAIGLIVLGLCSLIFAIVGAVKASRGEYWPYPLTIKFIR